MIAADSLLYPPQDHQYVAWDRALGRRFMLFVDTEEEFDWNAPFNRGATQVSAMRGLAEGQAFFARAGMRPVYLSDYPILQSDAAVALLRQWVADGTADVGAHLHPWVTPPHEEAVSVHNSFAGNLPPELERAKLLAQCTYMEERLGQRPVAYRAGRYGVGATTGRALVEAGFLLDCSIRSRFDYSAGHGPDFARLPLRPYRVGPDQALVELPLSTAFTGHLRGFGETMHGIARRSGKLGGALSRAGLFARVPLTPEGIPAKECIAAIDALIEEDVPVLSFSFHSPTLEPGHTDYVRNADDLAAFYRWWDVVLNHLARRGVISIGLDAFLAAVIPGHKTQNSCQAA
ncbi:MAG TPA: polysaccharide deacetylase family protein [Sphingobium sp.]|uniref:polysaccharide deacetylase family protein n=1 Tax=Sphingobium sp. TaxID=1912891 RepID=UPI002ECFF098